jgi:hypothetical protein
MEFRVAMHNYGVICIKGEKSERPVNVWSSVWIWVES